MSKIGYARVSTADQDTTTQIERLRVEGCTIIREEKVSGASRDGRSELETILAFLRPGDELIVVRLDRLGRDTRDVLNIVHEIKQRGACLTVLEPHVTTRGETGEIVLTVLGMVAKMERQFILERQRAGIAKAKAKGVYKGRPITLDHNQVKALAAEGVGATAIAKRLGCSRGAVYKILSAQTSRVTHRAS